MVEILRAANHYTAFADVFARWVNVVSDKVGLITFSPKAIKESVNLRYICQSS